MYDTSPGTAAGEPFPVHRIYSMADVCTRKILCRGLYEPLQYASSGRPSLLASFGRLLFSLEDSWPAVRGRNILLQRRSDAC